MGLRSLTFAIVKRDLQQAVRRPSDLLTIFCFFILSSGLFAIGVGPDSVLLKAIGVGVIWASALLASIMALSELFAADDRDGILEQLMLSPEPFVIIVLAKIFGHWLVTGLPLVLVAPFLGLLFGFNVDGLIMLSLSLLLGTPTLALLGAMGGALTLGVRGGVALAALLVLPFYVPVLIFGTLATNAALVGNTAGPHLALLVAILIFFLVFSPLLVALSLRAILD